MLRLRLTASKKFWKLPVHATKCTISTWPAQSKFAADGKFDELKEYQDMLIGGLTTD
ncbi:MAG: hypothetical protein R2778_15210 [Saprospiraceae bacterium]